MGPTGRKLGCPSASSSTNGTSGSYSYLRWEIIFGGPRLQGILPCGHMCMYIPGKSYCHLVLVKTHVSSFFCRLRGFCQIYGIFATYGYVFCFNNMLKKYRLLRVSASTLIKYKTKYALVIFWDITGFTQNRQKNGNTVSQVCISYLLIEQDTK